MVYTLFLEHINLEYRKAENRAPQNMENLLDDLISRICVCVCVWGGSGRKFTARKRMKYFLSISHDVGVFYQNYHILHPYIECYEKVYID